MGEVFLLSYLQIPGVHGQMQGRHTVDLRYLIVAMISMLALLSTWHCVSIVASNISKCQYLQIQHAKLV